MISEFEQVALTQDFPESGLKAGDVGTVVDITPNGKQLTLEFFNFSGDTVTVMAVRPEHVRRLESNDVIHARAILQ